MFKRLTVLLLLLGYSFTALGADWRDDYELAKGFRIDIDTTGYTYPTSIAFVPNPGSDPKSPLYYVTELRGTLKVVTNDRSVYTFAENFFNLEIVAELPEQFGEIGLVGLCLEPLRGYIYVTYAYQDETGYYRNGITRFETEPETFGLKPHSQKQIAPILKNFLSSVSHQIGPIAVHEDLLYVSIGDGEVVANSLDLNSPNGKVLRMTLDGNPAPNNPFAVDDDPNTVKNYLWVIGLRNAFSMKMANDKLFLGDNGPGIDRFIHAQAGDSFRYDGSDDSIAMNAMYVWTPAASPVQTEYDPERARGLGIPSPWADSFLVTLSGLPAVAPSRNQDKTKAIVALEVDMDSIEMTRAPQYLLRYRGGGLQVPIGLAYGHDGLYFTSLYADSEGNTPVMRISYEPENEHPHIMFNLDPKSLLHRYSCVGCHVIDGEGFGTAGPALDRMTLADTLLERLSSDEYRQQAEEVNGLETEPQKSMRQARQAVMDTEGLEKVRTWLYYRIREPAFDRKVTLMPNLAVSDEEANALVDWLLEPSDASVTTGLINFKNKVKSSLPPAGLKSYGTFFIVGGLFGALGLLTVSFLFRKYFRQRAV